MANDAQTTTSRSGMAFLHGSMRVATSFLLSLLFIWIVGYFFCNSLVYVKYDETLGKYIHDPGLFYKHRSEGIATTFKGRYGVNAIGDITEFPQEKLVVWGDSFVEAHQVDDPEKIPQQITKKLAARGFEKRAMAFAVGMSGDSVADYYFDMPKYEKLVPNVKAHYIIVTDVRDTLPDQPSDTIRGVFLSDPLRLTYVDQPPKFQGIKKKLNDFGLYFIWEPALEAMQSVRNLHFIPALKKNPPAISNGEEAENSSLGAEKKAWRFLFEELKKQTRLPLIFVICPTVPFIDGGTIAKTDPQADEVAAFSEVAEKHGIPVLDVSERFIQFYENTGLFPRGFPNSKPGEGHFNRFGQVLVAEEIVEHALTKGIL